MQTMKLFAYQKPARVEALLASLVLSRGELPDSARRVTDRSELPFTLQRLAIKAHKSERVWSAWADDEQVWFFTAELSLELSRERGRPALQVGSYAEAGRIRDWRVWVCLADGTWQPCTL